jgi:hypothetical protein
VCVGIDLWTYVKNSRHVAVMFVFGLEGWRQYVCPDESITAYNLVQLASVLWQLSCCCPRNDMVGNYTLLGRDIV